MAEENGIQELSPRKSSMKKRILLWGGVVFLLIFSFCVFLVCMLFTSPYAGPYQEPDSADFNRQFSIAGKLFRQVRKSPDRLCSMKLKTDEVNSAIRCAVFCHEKFGDKKGKISPRDLRLKYGNGLFYGVIPLDTGLRFLNGGVLEIYFAAKVSKVPGKITVNIREIKAGKFKLSAAKVNEKVENYLAGNNAKQQLSQLDDIIEEITPLDDGRLKISYYPQKLMAVVLKQINQLQTGAF